MVIATLLLVTETMVLSQAPSASARDVKLIDRVKSTLVARLDPHLPNLSLENWLQVEAGPKAEFPWEVNDCGEQTGTPADGGRTLPRCVEVDAKMRDERSIVIMVAMTRSTKDKTVWPVVYFAQLVTPRETINLRQLSDLPQALIKTHQQPLFPEIAR